MDGRFPQPLPSRSANKSSPTLPSRSPRLDRSLNDTRPPPPLPSKTPTSPHVSSSKPLTQPLTAPDDNRIPPPPFPATSRIPPPPSPTSRIPPPPSPTSRIPPPPSPTSRIPPPPSPTSRIPPPPSPTSRIPPPPSYSSSSNSRPSPPIPARTHQANDTRPPEPLPARSNASAVPTSARPPQLLPPTNRRPSPPLPTNARSSPLYPHPAPPPVPSKSEPSLTPPSRHRPQPPTPDTSASPTTGLPTEKGMPDIYSGRSISVEGHNVAITVDKAPVTLNSNEYEVEEYEYVIKQDASLSSRSHFGRGAYSSAGMTVMAGEAGMTGITGMMHEHNPRRAAQTTSSASVVESSYFVDVAEILASMKKTEHEAIYSLECAVDRSGSKDKDDDDDVPDYAVVNKNMENDTAHTSNRMEGHVTHQPESVTQKSLTDVNIKLTENSGKIAAQKIEHERFQGRSDSTPATPDYAVVDKGLKPRQGARAKKNSEDMGSSASSSSSSSSPRSSGEDITHQAGPPRLPMKKGTKANLTMDSVAQPNEKSPRTSSPSALETSIETDIQIENVQRHGQPVVQKPTPKPRLQAPTPTPRLAPTPKPRLPVKSPLRQQKAQSPTPDNCPGSDSASNEHDRNINKDNENNVKLLESEDDEIYEPIWTDSAAEC